jgi:hypothetical protein
MIKYSSFGVSLTTELQRVVPADDRRRGLILVNTSPGAIYFGFSSGIGKLDCIPILTTQSFTFDISTAQNDIFMMADANGYTAVVAPGTEVD